MKKLILLALLCFLAISMQAQNGGTKFPVKNYQEFVNIRNKNANGKLLQKGVYKKYILQIANNFKEVDIPHYPDPCYIEVYEKYIYHANIINGKLEDIGVAHFVVRDYDPSMDVIIFSYNEKHYEWENSNGAYNYAQITFQYSQYDDGDDFISSDEEINDIIRLIRSSSVSYKHLGDISTATSKTVPAGYVDLGLPSGTLWKDTNEEGGLYTYEQAVAKYGSSLPTKEQLEELKNSCSWSWTGSGYKVTGPSGESIVLPAAGFRYCDGGVSFVGLFGYYWSSTPSGSAGAWNLSFSSSEVYMYHYNNRCDGLSVRLVR